MVRSRAKRRYGSKQTAPEQGDGWLARVVRAENTMAEKVDQLEGKQSSMSVRMSMMHLLV
jgi:hypothetical protein